MSTKTRSALFLGAYSGATIRAREAQEKLAAAQREAGRAAAEEWSIRMQMYGGPAQPSPTIGQCINGGYPWLMVECQRCRTEAKIPLTRLKRKPDAPIWRLEPSLRCSKFRTRRYSPPVRLVKLMVQEERSAFQVPTREDRG